MSLFSTSATLRPSRCLLLRLASGPMLLRGNLDVKFRQRPSELGHSVTAGRVLVRHPKDGMLVGVEGDGFTVAAKIGLQRLEIGKCALRCDKAQLHQAACRIVDEHQ